MRHRVPHDRRRTYIDGYGAQVIEPQFDNAYYFRSGIAEVRHEGSYTYVDRAGSRV